MSIKHVVFYALLKTASENCVFFAREEVGFKLQASTAGGEEDGEVLTRTRMYFHFLLEMSL